MEEIRNADVGNKNKKKEIVTIFFSMSCLKYLAIVACICMYHLLPRGEEQVNDKLGETKEEI